MLEYISKIRIGNKKRLESKELYISKGIGQDFYKKIDHVFSKSDIKVQAMPKGSIDTLLKVTGSSNFTIFLLSEDDELLKQDILSWKGLNTLSPFLIVPVFDGEKGKETIENLNVPKDQCYHYLTLPIHPKSLESVIYGGFQFLKLLKEKHELEETLQSRSKEIYELTEIGKALSSETNYNKLLNLILAKGKEITQCDAASIYLVKNNNKEKTLTFILSDLKLPDEENHLPLNEKSISGYVALTGEVLNIEDAYHLPKGSKYSLNLKYDKEYGYRTKSMLVLPMKDHEGRIIGVIQLINKKKSKSVDLTTVKITEREVIPFPHHDVELALSLAGQAAVAIESSHLKQRSKEIRELTDIGKALATERNYHKLLRFILEKGKEITHSDAGSIYLVKTNETGEKYLSFMTSDLMLQQKEVTIAINKKSIAGYVASTGTVLNIEDAYHTPKKAEYTLNLDYDKKHNYRTKSLLVVPMTNQKNDVIGVLQLINKKKDGDIILSTIESMEKNVISYDDRDIDLIASVAGQAAVSIENNTLYQNIENLFEGFVKASVTAIESRDPTTSGHSERVALYTVKLAEIVDRIDTGIWGHVQFTRDQIKEIRYASLLHDFGKVGVREKVLIKAKKLYYGQMELIKSRFDFIKRTLQYESSQRKIQYLLEKSREEALQRIQQEDNDLTCEIKEMDLALEAIITANGPTVLQAEMDNTVNNIAIRTYLDIFGQTQNFITKDELTALSIKKGSLREEERLEIESHVTHTFEFLSTIPWTSELKHIPEIAYGHHEKLNGEGYPRKLIVDSIPLQSRIMTVSDIYDALTAADRPYKKAVSMERALDILKLEVKDQHVDPDIVNLFIDAQVFKVTQKAND